MLEATIAKPLGTSVDDACAAIIEVANASMLKMLRIVTVEKGLDPADFTLVAFGGNGPVFGIELADELGMREVVIPPAPGLLSAQGLLAADLRYDFRQTYVGAAPPVRSRRARSPVRRARSAGTKRAPEATASARRRSS